MMRNLLLAATALMAVGAAQAPAAFAAPDLAFRVYQDGVLQAGPGLSGTSNTGALSANGTTSNFSFVGVFALGFPITPQPSLTSNATVSSRTGLAAPSTIRIEFTQYGIDRNSAGGALAQLANSFTQNFLVGGGVSSVTTTNYADASNAMFGQATLLATLTSTSATGPTNDSGLRVSPTFALPNALFSETVVISATFTSGGATLTASSQIQAVPVPEPMSLALFGMGLAGLGLVGQRRRKA